MEIVIISAEGELVATVSAAADDHISWLHKHLEQMGKGPSWKQMLVYGETILNPCQTLANSSLVDGARITLILSVGPNCDCILSTWGTQATLVSTSTGDSIQSFSDHADSIFLAILSST